MVNFHEPNFSLHCDGKVILALALNGDIPYRSRVKQALKMNAIHKDDLPS